MVNLKRWVLLCAVLVPWMTEAQNISVQAATGQSPATFVSEQLQGSGVYIWNVKYNNSTSNINAPMIGTFQSNGYQMLQMDSGVVMTTGNVSVAPGPNNYGMTSESVSSGYYEDTQLNQYLASGQSVTYCSTLDFDFVSISPFVTLNYCFGSEEYPNYVWTSFNDIFAFLVTGPYPSTTMKNIAIVPHTVTTANPNGIAVAINTVNGKTGTENPSAGWYHYNEFFVQNYISESNWQSGNGAQGVQYNGFTQKLSANATLVPCAQYHMHISICNVNDGAYDSGVFLEKKSFNSPSADVDLSHRYADTIERSQSAQLPLTLAGTDYNYGKVTVTYSGDAVIGEDYTIVTDSNRTLDMEHRIFYVDNLAHWLRFKPTATADLHSPKHIELFLSTSLCEDHPELKTYDTIRYILVEDDILRMYDTTIVAYDTCHEVGVEARIGTPTTFLWIPEDGIDFPHQQYSTATITESSQYRVAVADAKGHVDTADVTIEVRPRNAIEQLTEPAYDIQVYPNPADDELNIAADGITVVEVFNAAGVCVFSRRCNDDCRTLNISPLPAGMYTVRITTNLGTKTEKVLVR